jgi:ferredoxin
VREHHNVRYERAMTPFGIRKRLKALLGIAPPARREPEPELPPVAVSFVRPGGERFEVTGTKGDTLVLVSGRGDWPIATGCKDSTCATCQVDVLDGAGALTATTDHELDTLRRNGAPETRRLGCRARVMGPGVVVGMVNVAEV